MTRNQRQLHVRLWQTIALLAGVLVAAAVLAAVKGVRF